MLAPVLLAAVAAVPRPAAALEASLTASRDSVAVGEQFTVAVEVRHDGVGSVPKPDLPPVEHVDVVSRYESSGFSYINGRATSSVTVQYVLQATEEGTVRLGPVTVAKGDDEVTSNAVEIRVLPAGSSATVPKRFGSEGTTSSDGGRDLIVLGQVDDESPYVNEQIAYTFTFLRRVRILEGTRYERPDWTGFWNEEIDVTEPTEVTVEGRRYIAERVRTALFPTAPGSYEIGSATLRATVEDTRRTRRDPFDIFGGDRFGIFRTGREVVLQTDPIAVQVKPLPEQGKPRDFSGAVGTFQLTAEADKDSVKAGEAITLRVTLSGNGNVKVVPAPDLSVLTDFKIYESNAEESAEARSGRIFGTKTWEFVLVPVTGGDVEIPPVRISVFDPDKGAYETLATAPIPVKVEATDLDEALARGDDLSVAKERVRLRQRDIRYVKPAPERLARGGGSPFTRPGFLMAHLFPALAFAGSTLLRRHRERLRSDVRYARRRGAAKAARRRLDAAREAAGRSDVLAAFGELSAALRGYVADRLHLAAANLDETEVRRELAAAHVPAEEVDELFAVLEACDTARFSPLGTDPVGARELLERGEAWIRKGERR